MDRDRGLIGPRDRSDGGCRLVLIVAVAFVAGACTGSNKRGARACRPVSTDGRARNAAIQAARASLDLQLRYRPQAEIDLARMDLRAAQLLVDEAAGDADGVGTDQFALDYDRDRIRDAVDARDLVRINIEIGAIQAAAAAAERLRVTLADLQPLG